MKIAIIGAGFVGLSAAYKLTKKGHDVTLFESSKKPGGLASGFKEESWDWTLEEHYHHWFTNDKHVRKLAKEIGHEVSFFHPKTSVYVNHEIHQLDSPLSLLALPGLNFVDKIRTGVTLLYLKITPFWKQLEAITAKEFLTKTMGLRSWETLWRPLFIGKFGKDAGRIPASWFWARIRKRTPSLGYPKGGFLEFAKNIEKHIQEKGGRFKYNSRVEKIEKTKKGLRLTVNGKHYSFDKVICTLPTSIFLNITEGLPTAYIQKLEPLKGIGAVTLVLSMKSRFFHEGTYWLNINSNRLPFLAVVEHTHLVSRRHYDGDHILYVGNYLPPDHTYFQKTANQLLDEFTPALKKINKEFKTTRVKKAWKFSAPFAQPIIPLGYSKNVPRLSTPIKGLYLANIQQVYPWDRGTNYAVELGERVAELIINS